LTRIITSRIRSVDVP
jgi:hypothetical protein